VRVNVPARSTLDDALIRILGIAPHFAQSQGPGGVPAAVCKEAIEAFGCDVALLLSILDPDHFAVGWREPPSSLVPPGKTFLVDELPDLRDALRDLRTMFEPDMPGQLRGEPKQIARSLGTKSAVRVPISVYGQAARVLVLQWLHEIAEPDAETLVALRRFADQAGLALEHAARREAEERARRNAEETERLLAVTQALSVSHTVAEVAETLTAEGRTRTGASAAATFVLEGSELRLAASEGLDAAAHAEWSSVAVDEPTALADAMRRNELVLVESSDVRASRYPLDVRRRPTESFASISLPLAAGSTPVGGLELSFADERTFESRDREFLGALGRQGGLALERALLLESERLGRARAELLAATAAALEEGRDMEEVGQRLVEQLVPELADLACITVPTERGQVLAVAPRESELEPVLRELLDEGSVRSSGWVSVSRVVTGETPGAGAALSQVTERPGDEGARRMWEALGLRSTLVVPLTVGRTAAGELLLGLSSADRAPYAVEDIALVRDIAAQAGARLENARLQAQERSIASRLQQQLLPQRLPDVPGIRAAGHYRAGAESMDVGGDWYDVFLRASTCVAFTVGDVVGKGVTAAGVMGRLRSAVRALGIACGDPVEVIGQLESFATTVDGAEFASLCYADLDVESGELRYLHAGHLPILLVGPDGEAQFLEDGRTSLLCVPMDSPREHARRVLEPGTTLVLYSDGLVERRGEPLNTALLRLRELATSLASLAPEELASTLASRMTAGQAANDDIVVLAVRFDGLPAARLVHEFPASAEELATTRKVLREWLAEHTVDGSEQHEISVVVNEACANAVEHAYADVDGETEPTVRLEAEIEDGRELVVVVQDHGRWRAPRLAGERGRGTSIMRALADSVATTTGPVGTVVTIRRRVGDVRA